VTLSYSREHLPLNLQGFENRSNFVLLSLKQRSDAIRVINEWWPGAQ
jgi:hypothetical protein